MMEALDLAIPILPSRDVAETVAFYRRLGFEGGAHAADAGYAILRRGALELHFFLHRGLVPSASSAGCYIRVADVETLHAAFAAAQLPRTGIPRMDSLEDKPWGLREFAVVDPDGNLLRVGQIIEREPARASLNAFPAEGGCDCRAVRYRLLTPPLIVHCCHCRWCQRESGAAFAVNAMFESDRVVSTGVDPDLVDTPSESGLGQKIARCPHCRVAVWSHYAGSGLLTKFVRVGTLDQPDLLPPDIHIFTAAKQPWVQLPPGQPAFEEFYDRNALWPAESLERLRVALRR